MGRRYRGDTNTLRLDYQTQFFLLHEAACAQIAAHLLAIAPTIE